MDNVEFKDKLVSINRITKVVKGGRRFAFSALVVVGNQAGSIGLGHSKAKQVPDAIKKATENAKNNLFKIPLREGRTLHHDVLAKEGSGKVILRSAPKGTGIIASGAIRAVCEVAGIKDIKGAPVGDTLIDFNDESTNALPGFKKVNPKVFASLFTLNSDDYEKFRDALSKLVLNDSSLIYEPEVSDALGFGFRCGFLGTLHMEVVRERLEREYDLDLISTAPSVEYEVLKTDGEILKCDNPSQLPTPNEIDEIREPIVNITIISPNEYVGNIITLCTSKRGTQKDMKYFGNQVSIIFEMPLSSVIIDFFDQIKSSTKGFASIEYSLIGFQKSNLTKIDVLINNNKIDALSMIVHKSFSTSKAREIAKNLQKLIPRQMFDVPIQVALGAKIISRETVKAYRKNVTAKLYGGDVTRKMKLLEKQKQGKKKMKQLGKVSIPQDAFLNYFNSEQ